MRWTVGVRGVAIGVAYGIAASAETIRLTPDLRSGTGSLLPALQLISVFLFVYASLGFVLGLALAALGAIARWIGVPAIERLGSSSALWPFVFLLLGFSAFNEVVRGSDALDAHRHGIRAAFAIVAVLVLARALRRPWRTSAGVRWIEAALASLWIPAALGTALYATRPLPGAAGTVSTGGILALAPRFAPEPTAAFAQVQQASPTRVLLIGIDGASWDRIDRGIAAGRLPTFARLREHGVHAPLQSVVPTYSPSIWTSMMTGVPASEHGIEDFYLTQLTRLGIQNFHLRRAFSPIRIALDAAGELRFVPVTSSLRRRKAIWNLADEAGLRSAVIGLWATWPPESLQNGVVVSDHASLARQQEWLDRGRSNQHGAGITTYPPELADRLAAVQRAPDSVTREELASFIEVDDATWQEFGSVHSFSKGVPLSAFRSSHLNDDFYARAAQQIWGEQRPDLMVLYLRAVDELSHFFCEAGVPEARALGWSERDVRRFGSVVDRIYEWTDRAIAPLVDEALRDPGTLLVIVSDHGWEREPDGHYNHNHAPPGVLMLNGAGVCARNCPALGAPSIYDVAPTVLERLGLPLSAQLVGHPLDAAFVDARGVTRVAEYGAPVNEARSVVSDADAQMREKLEALGYVRK